MRHDRPRPLDRLERSVLSTQVSRAIMEGILRGRFRPGDRLVENELAEMLGISRSPIREALTDLDRSGLITREPGRGATIRKWGAHDLEELFSVRGLLEGQAARLVAAEAPALDVRPFETIMARMEETAHGEDYAAMVELDLEFHRTLWSLAGNRLLAQVLEGLSHQFRLFLTLNWRFHGGLHHVADNHRRLLAGLASGDPERAERAMQEHVVVERMREAFEAQSAPLQGAAES